MALHKAPAHEPFSHTSGASEHFAYGFEGDTQTEIFCIRFAHIFESISSSLPYSEHSRQRTWVKLSRIILKLYLSMKS